RAAARATADLIRFGIDLAAVEFLDERTVRALNRLGGFGLAETPCLLVEVHGSEAGVGETWAAAEEVMAGAGGSGAAAPGGPPWALRGQAARAMGAPGPGAAAAPG